MNDTNTTLRPESPLNYKDPIKEQIERDAEIATFDHFGYIGFVSGAIAQDKIATNRTVEAAMMIVGKNAPLLKNNRAWNILLKELEKLKRV